MSDDLETILKRMENAQALLTIRLKFPDVEPPAFRDIDSTTVCASLVQDAAALYAHYQAGLSEEGKQQ